MRLVIGGILSILFCCAAAGQAGREKVEEGNRLFEAGQFQQALEKYRQAQEENPDSPIVRYNLGNARYKNQSYEEAAGDFSGNLQAPARDLRARSFYNLGNSLFRQGKLEESVGAYQDALRIDPADRDAKFNLELAMEKLQQKQQEQNQQGESDDSNPPRESESGENRQPSRQGDEPPPSESPQGKQSDQGDGQGAPDDSQPNAPNEPSQEQNRPDQEQSEEPGQAKPEPQDSSPTQDASSDASAGRPSRMTKEQAERLLQALEANRKGLIKRELNAKDRVRVKKDW